MNGTLAAFHSSDAESAYSGVSSSSDSFESEKDGSSDDEPLVQAAMEASLPDKASKLARVEKICAFRCSLEGFIVCNYCRRALINVDACKSHITKFHKSQAEWLSPLPANETLDNMSMTQLQELYDRPGSKEPRKPFDGIVIQDGFKCTNCFSTFISAQTSRRHLSDCRGKREHYTNSCEVSATSVMEQSENQGQFSTHFWCDTRWTRESLAQWNVESIAVWSFRRYINRSQSPKSFVKLATFAFRYFSRHSLYSISKIVCHFWGRKVASKNKKLHRSILFIASKCNDECWRRGRPTKFV